nr:MAG TPA: Naegleria Tet-like dioxygenase-METHYLCYTOSINE, DIOXYGENASE-DNA COMPLEX, OXIDOREDUCTASE-DNA complex [Caudoviricetes sp.]
MKSCLYGIFIGLTSDFPDGAVCVCRGKAVRL